MRVYISGTWLNFIIPTTDVAIIHNPAKEAQVIPTGIVFITRDKVYMHQTIVIAVIILGINKVKP